MSSPLLQADKIEREFARRRLAEFVPFMDPTLVPAAHHLIAIEQFQRVERGELARLMVFMPPGHAKSKYFSEYGPAWYEGKNKKRTIIHAAYGTDFAERFGRRIRNIMKTSEYVDVFGPTLSGDSRAAGEWETLEGGEYKAAGVGAGITGRRFDLGLIDDPVKGRLVADSPTYRESTWQWYLGDFRTRAKPGAAIVLIQTRWHEDDLAGRILPKNYDFRSGPVVARDGEVWMVLNFPAICERLDDMTGRAIGEALWPGYIPLAQLLQEKLSQGSRNFDALYQQRPRPGEGGIFKEAWFRHRYGVIPVEADVCIHSWDTAQKEGELNDMSALTSWNHGRGALGYYLREVFADKLEYPYLRQKVIAFAERDRPAAILIEDKSSGASLIQDLRNSTSLPIIAIEPVGDKIFRASEISAMCEAGLVHLPGGGPWLIDFEGELFGFPLSTYKDRIDSFSQYLKWIRTWNASLAATGTGARVSIIAAIEQEGPDEYGELYGSTDRTDTRGY